MAVAEICGQRTISLAWTRSGRSTADLVANVRMWTDQGFQFDNALQLDLSGSMAKLRWNFRKVDIISWS